MRSIYTLIFCALSYISFAGTLGIDSAGLETKGDNDFIIHKVEEGETLYSLSRRYNVPIYEIIKNNPPTEFGLDPGQIIKIPIIKKNVEVVEKVQPAVTEQVKSIDRNSGITESKEPAPTSQELKSTFIASSPSDYIEHTVEEKETLYAISRKYEVNVDDIKKWNNLTSNALNIGQKLKIFQKTEIKEPGNNALSSANSSSKTHEVKASETLYSISKLYNVEIANLKKWNKLRSNEISIGQLLIVGEPKLLDEPNAKIEPVSEIVEIKKPNDTVKSPEIIDTTKYIIKPERKQLYNEVFESGLAEQIEGSANNRKYLALHKTAEIGTIIKVRNEMNDQEVFVRVIGKLPNTSVNDNLVIKLSKSAYERLGAIDPKFRVSISYIP